MSQSELCTGVLRDDIAWEVSWNLSWTESVNWALIELSDLSYEVSTLFNQLALGLLIELVIQFALELLKLGDIGVLSCLDTVQCHQLVLCLSVKLSLDALHEGIKLFNPILLGLLDLLNTAADLTQIIFQISESSTETTGLASDQVHVPLVNLLQLFKRVTLVLVTKQSTVTANGNLACLAEVTQSSVMLRTELLSLLLILACLSLHHLLNVREKPAWYELVRAQVGSAVWALGSCLFNPFAETVVTAKL